ncbi:hypothetical protein RCL_jg16038.t1 [Rhizophagus clarus]|uniref:Uncharacterized protein n=1 Tax=Rhizophagus clarus TaxID=94130 RepID=A0A8H3QJI8_9GLOM|nr:hypothetical protein RCL_jg16038.t1 [Rhizophagus clarus]
MKSFIYMFMANINKWERIILKKRYTTSYKTHPKFEAIMLSCSNACTEISLAKAEADNFAKLEEVKLLQFVINLLTPEYSGKNNQSDLYVKGGLIDALHGKKNDISTSSIIDTPDSPIQGEKTSDNQSYLLLWQMRFW